jgi:glycerophosphoryl diester phosphodiesterase
MRIIDRLRERPLLFHRRDGEITAHTSSAFTVAHNAGDDTRAAREALAHGADIIEIDVMTRGGRLVAGHPRRAWIFSRVCLWTIPLDEAWAAAASATAVKLDLKESSPEYVRAVVAFLATRRDVPAIAVSRDAAVLRALTAECPWVGRFLSITPEGLAALKRDEGLAALIDGVSGHPDRFDPETIAWLRERRLASMTSVVNSVLQANDLLRRGVNGIITDNLAIMEDIARTPPHRDVPAILFQKR